MSGSELLVSVGSYKKDARRVTSSNEYTDWRTLDREHPTSPFEQWEFRSVANPTSDPVPSVSAFLLTQTRANEEIKTYVVIKVEDSVMKGHVNSCELECVFPFVQWRLKINGVLTGGVQVKGQIRWRATADPFRYDTELHKAPPVDGPLGPHVYQPGLVGGMLELGPVTYNLDALRGYRTHMWGPSRGVLDATGWAHSIHMDSPPRHCRVHSWGGCVIGASRNVPVKRAVEKSENVLNVSLGKGARGESRMNFRFDDVCALDEKTMWTKYTIDDKTGYGLREITGPVEEVEEGESMEVDSQVNDLRYVVIIDKGCTDVSVVGGKGAQLGELCGISEKVAGFSVPGGFVVSARAHAEHVKKHPESPERSRLVEEVKKCGGSESSCEALCQWYLSSGVIDTVSEAICDEYNARSSGYHPLVAVRSSGILEDAADASSAGQLDTFLGVSGSDDVVSAVARCWASNYTFRAVQYRLKHGQSIDTDMAVVVQELVDADTAGVLFTVHPVSGKSDEMVITSSVGLGESVVSGTVDPDTILLSRGDNSVSVGEITVGSKETRVLAEGSVEDVPEEERKKCSLSEEDAIRLGTIALGVEDSFGSARDMEWCIRGGDIYLLQARPVTTQADALEDDLLHEFDTALFSDSGELLTHCNIGEMCPGAIPPLTLDVFMFSIEYGMQDLLLKAGAFGSITPTRKIMPLFYSHGFINLLQDCITCVDIGMNDIRTTSLVLCGQLIDDLSLENAYKFHGPGKPSWWTRFRNNFKFIKGMKNSEKRIVELENMLKTYKIDSGETSLDTWKIIDDALPVYYEGWSTTIAHSARSGSWCTVLMSVLSKGKDWSVDNYTDVAALLSKCEGVESADVPAAVEDLVSAIIEEEKQRNSNAFETMSDEEALIFLNDEEKHSAVAKRFSAFLERHGHRCVREADFRTPSWRRQPLQLVNVIKSVYSARSCGHTHVKTSETNQVEERLQKELNWIGRKTLNWALPKARRGVGEREYGKSLAVLLSDKFKEAYWALAEQLVNEKMLPEKDLMFFLIHNEIGSLCEGNTGRNAELTRRAMQRRRIHELQASMSFKDISFGIPEATLFQNRPKRKEGETELVLHGMPVSRGIVTGPARVVTSLDDARNMLPGEILVCRYTDVGWSPFFPLAAALVTEMGGLLSHGAVVAREYGIPCVVGCVDCTSMFTTGDSVTVDGNRGTLSLAEKKQ